MDLELNDDQVALRDGIRSLLAGRFASDRIRAGFDRSMWQELGEAGVWSLRTDGFAWSDVAVVFEQLGEFCVPGPLVAGVLSHGLVDGVVGGVDRPEPGTPARVEHLEHLDRLVVLDPSGVAVLDAASLTASPASWPLDPLTPLSVVETLPAGSPLGGPELVGQWHTAGAVLTAAFAMGMASRLADMSVAYAKERVQFDRPIAGFQAIKHLLADMAVRAEVARAAVYAAAAHLDDANLPGLARAVAGAKSLAGEAAVLNGKTATQVHGGMGFTWEVDVHLYLKRAWVLDTHFGSADAHADAVFASLGVA